MPREDDCINLAFSSIYNVSPFAESKGNYTYRRVESWAIYGLSVREGLEPVVVAGVLEEPRYKVDSNPIR